MAARASFILTGSSELAAGILFDAIKRAGSDDPVKMKDALAATKDYQGVSGNISMDANRDAQKKLVIMKISNGAIEFADVVNP